MKTSKLFTLVLFTAFTVRASAQTPATTSKNNDRKKQDTVATNRIGTGISDTSSRHGLRRIKPGQKTLPPGGSSSTKGTRRNLGGIKKTSAADTSKRFNP